MTASPDTSSSKTGASSQGETEAVKDQAAVVSPAKDDVIKEIGGPKGPEPTRYGDWERNGRCSDF
ncbi:DUF1674 domain-containing protein [Rhodospirillaceae bacterium AH-315-P19]|nr:DUF1674 domain-containing protein [Rhodospirillaceae bacterium AH-315-P19]